MEPDFWHNKWSNNEIGFHEQHGNALLKHFFSELALNESDNVFVPLCGKTKDIPWLMIHNVNVIGIELNESAVDQLFEEMNVEPNISSIDDFKLYEAENVKIFVGDFFKLTSKHVGPIQAIYDRGAVVALPFKMRTNYCKLLQTIALKAKHLVITFSYPQEQIKGPPFSVSDDEIQTHYQQNYKINTLYHSLVQEPFRGFDNVYESVFLLEPKSI